MLKQAVGQVDIKNTEEDNKALVYDALLWLLTYEHLEVFLQKEFDKSNYTDEYPLIIHFEGINQKMVFANVELMRLNQAEEAVEVVTNFGILGLVAWFAYRNGVNDVIPEYYKTKEYNEARKFLGLGIENQLEMEDEMDLNDPEENEEIIVMYSNCECDLVKIEGEYQSWVHLMSDLDEE